MKDVGWFHSLIQVSALGQLIISIESLQYNEWVVPH